MRKLLPFLLAFILFLSSCGRTGGTELDDKQRISFLSKYNVSIDTSRPYYSSKSRVPQIFDTVWQIRAVLSKRIPNVDISRYKGSQCSIYMYPVHKLPFEIKNQASIEAKAVLIACNGKVICSYIEFISELRSIAPMTLDGKSVALLSGAGWEKWKERMESDDNKTLVIYQYYNALRSGNYDEAYTYIYDKSSIGKDNFIKSAKQNSLPFLDFIYVDQYKEPVEDECYYLVEANVIESGKKKDKYEIVFDLKIDEASSDYGGWKIYRTQIK